MKYPQILFIFSSGIIISCMNKPAPVVFEMPEGSWQSALVQVNNFGKLTYNPCPDGFVIPDFSYAGYKNGEPIPNYRPPASRIETVTPLPNANSCNAAHIQQAIDKIAALQPDADGFRGVIQLGPGRYNVDATINLNASGIVLRGAGRGPDKAAVDLTETDLQNMTMIYRRGTGEGLATHVVIMGAASAGGITWAGNTDVEDSKVNISTQKVMPGDMTFEVESAAAYSAGDAICIRYPNTNELLEALWYGGNSNWVIHGREDQRWRMQDVNIAYHRYITKIEGNKITIDAPIFYVLDRQYSIAYMYKITTGTIYHNIGIEDLRISMDRTPSSVTGSPDQNCIKMNALENSWAKGLHLSDYIHAGIKTEATTRITVEDCRSVDPSGSRGGGNHYSFENFHRSQLILFKNCFSREGRHGWISNGTATVNGIVLLNHTNVNNRATAAAEGHRYLSQGMLLDGWKDHSTEGINSIGFFLRDNMGTFHGWGGIFSVLWNCDIQNSAVLLDKVPTGQNYSIGSIAETVSSFRSYEPYITGYNEGHNTPGLYPKSLYEAQLFARKNR